MKSPTVTLLIQHFLDWQKELGQVKTMREFAILLDLHEGTLNRIMNGKQAISKGVAIQLAQKLNDPRFYALEELPEPDLDFEKLMQVWQYIPRDKKRELREQGENYVTENRKKGP